jgi:UDP-N-acetylmuramoyl-tripeptide--D-alanyl-D-alanine ligase
MATVIPDNCAAFSLEALAHATGGQLRLAGDATPETLVRGVVTDSRKVTEGQLYVALRGENHDGHRFLVQAQERGASAALVSDLLQAPEGLSLICVDDTRAALGAIARAHRLVWGRPVVAITGSAGKTTTKEITARLLSSLGHEVLRTQGNLNNDIGLPMTLLGLSPAHDVAVVEIGTSGPGEIEKLAKIASPTVGVVTTVSLAHTAGLGSLEAVADEKHMLLSSLPRDGVAIDCADSAPLRARRARIHASRALSFGEHPSADVQLLRYRLTESLTTECVLRVAGLERELTATLGLCGHGPALDAAAALSVVLALHGAQAVPKAALALAEITPVAGRLAPVITSNGSLIIDDTYNANPASMEASLETLTQIAAVRGGRAIAVLGDMAELGEHAQAEHVRIGTLAAKLGVAQLIGCGPQMHAAVEAARSHAPEGHVLIAEHVSDPQAAAKLVAACLGARDAVLLKGSRSMAMERVLASLVPEGARS